ncbi:general secretion pathway protein GspB [Paucibacter sp. AS339]|uniref:general secretion pathway protein GspB n=1 Tax=Paucibacter hankyongi TaxID=3133434 RepID=UPI0030B099ED
MSYILEALKRAEAERERGSLPNLLSQTVAPDLNGAEGHKAAPHPLARPVPLALLLLSLLALGIWLGRGFKAEEASAPPAAVPTVSTAPPAPIQPPSVAPIAAAPPINTSRLSPPPPAPEPMATPLAVPKAAPMPLPTASAAPPASQTATKSAAIPLLKELPDALRRELPALSASGAMYSDTPANRMLIINGQLLHEGEHVAAGLTLEQIELKSAVLSYKGQRFRINY